MKLAFDQLDTHLGRGLSGAYVIASDEPLLTLEATDKVRRKAASEGFDERKTYFVDRTFRWEQLAADSDSLSLFSSRRIVEIRMATPRPGDAGGKALRALAESADSDRLVIVTIQARLDKAANDSVWLRTFARHGVVLEMPVIGRSALPRFIESRARQKGLTIERDAAELLADRTEGNLLAADQELIKLALIADASHIDARRVLDAVAGDARFDVFRLSDAILAGDLERALIVLDGLRAEGTAPQLVAWAIVREITVLARLKSAEARRVNLGELMRSLRIWSSRHELYRRALARYSIDDLTALLERAVRADRSVKGLERSPPWGAVTGLVLALLAPVEYRRLA